MIFLAISVSCFSMIVFSVPRRRRKPVSRPDTDVGESRYERKKESLNRWSSLFQRRFSRKGHCLSTVITSQIRIGGPSISLLIYFSINEFPWLAQRPTSLQHFHREKDSLKNAAALSLNAATSHVLSGEFLSFPFSSFQWRVPRRMENFSL